MRKILAIDYGTKRIGLAVSRATLADPLKIIENNEQVVDTLKKIIEIEKIELLLIGISERAMAEQTRAFALQLEKALGLPIEFMDETLSSESVHHKLATGPMKLSRRRQPIDHYAAAEILQEWLDTSETL